MSRHNGNNMAMAETKKTRNGRNMCIFNHTNFYNHIS